MGKEPQAFDLLFWNADQTRMPKALHMYYLRSLYGENALAKGEFDDRRGQASTCRKVKIPLYFQASPRGPHRADRTRSIARRQAVRRADVTFTLAGSGHIAGVINAPVANKYQHWTNDALPATLERMAGRRGRASGQLVAALGGLAAGQVGQADPRPRPGQGAR